MIRMGNYIPYNTTDVIIYPCVNLCYYKDPRIEINSSSVSTHVFENGNQVVACISPVTNNAIIRRYSKNKWLLTLDTLMLNCHNKPRFTAPDMTR